ncbi:MAG: NnrU family protein [Pseudomonadota bacterium]
MLLLCVGLILFIVFHLLPTNVSMRAGLAGKFGEAGVKGIVAVGSLIGFLLIIYGYGKMQGSSKNPVLWDPPIWTQHITLLLMVFSMIALAATYIPSRIQSALKHPMLLAVKIWALAHLLANGDLASVLLFGGFLAWAVYDRISLKRRGNLGPGPSNASIVNDVAVIAVGLGLYAVMVKWGHAYLIGVGVIG